MIILYTLAVCVTVLCLGSLVLGFKELGKPLSIRTLIDELRQSAESPKNKSSIYLFAFFISLILLPLFWGLAIYLKTDANVLAVLVTMVWGYNLIKYIFPVQAESEDEQKSPSTE
jgi:hypothetical protein